MAPKGPYKLVTVNTAPERAKRLVGRMIEALKDQYTIEHVANCESKYPAPRGFAVSVLLTLPSGIDEVEGKVKEFQPDVLVRSNGLPPFQCDY